MGSNPPFINLKLKVWTTWMLGIKLLVCYTNVIEHSKVSFKYIILSVIAFQ